MELDWKRIWFYIGGNNLEGTPSLSMAQNNVMLANNYSQCQYQPPCSSYSSGQNFFEKMWSDQGLFLVQNKYFFLAEAVNRWHAAPCNTPSIWRSSPLSIIQASKSDQLLWLKKIPSLSAVYKKDQPHLQNTLCSWGCWQQIYYHKQFWLHVKEKPWVKIIFSLSIVQWRD